MHRLHDTEVVTNNPFKKIEIGTAVYATSIYITTVKRYTVASFDLSNKSFIFVRTYLSNVSELFVFCNLTNTKQARVCLWFQFLYSIITIIFNKCISLLHLKSSNA